MAAWLYFLGVLIMRIIVFGSILVSSIYGNYQISPRKKGIAEFAGWTACSRPRSSHPAGRLRPSLTGTMNDLGLGSSLQGSSVSEDQGASVEVSDVCKYTASTAPTCCCLPFACQACKDDMPLISFCMLCTAYPLVQYILHCD